MTGGVRYEIPRRKAPERPPGHAPSIPPQEGPTDDDDRTILATDPPIRPQEIRGRRRRLRRPDGLPRHAGAAPSETVYHASFGASGMAGADIGSLTASKNLKLVAVADVDLRSTGRVKKLFPDVKVYQDWRELLDKEKHLDSVNVSTPDHMHAPITMRPMQRGLNVYTQKPLTQTIYEARQLAKVAREKKLVTADGHPDPFARRSTARSSRRSSRGRSAR